MWRGRASEHLPHAIGDHRHEPEVVSTWHPQMLKYTGAKLTDKEGPLQLTSSLLLAVSSQELVYYLINAEVVPYLVLPFKMKPTFHERALVTCSSKRLYVFTSDFKQAF